MLRIVGTYVFNVVGDDVTKEMLIPLRGFKAPDPIIDTAIPTGFFDAKVGASPGGASAVLEGEFVHVTFDVPPPSTVFTKVTIDALFGTTRI